MRCLKIFSLPAIILLLAVYMPAQTTGKISGRVVDANGEALAGANVILAGTTMGAAADLDGYYYIINVRAGTYKLQFRYLGYKSKIIENVIVSSDQTTTIDAVLEPEVIEGEVVTITAQKPLVEFNQTSSIATVTEDDIAKLPVQDLTEIVNLQAGVVDGHFRGGRTGEVQYQVDGVTVNNPYNNASTLTLDRSVIQEVQVISGTFDAKYGQAMSGVVNAVLRSGTDKFQISGEVYTGDYYTADVNRYPNNKEINPGGIQNYQLTLSGPAYFDKTTFLLSGRRFSSNGYLFGRRVFLPTDRADFERQIFTPTGDGELIPMNTEREWSGQFKIANQSVDKLQLSYQAIGDISERQYYNHSFRLNPDGIKTAKTISVSHGADITHTLSNSLFYKISIRQNYFDFSDYRYEDLFDPNYYFAGEPKGDANYEYGAAVQGVDLSRFIQKTVSGIAKADITWQADRSNLIEFGLESMISKMQFGAPGFFKSTTVEGVQMLVPSYGTEPEDPKIETYYPRQFSAYLQDRLEWGDLVVRGGVRLEYFDANSNVPSDLQNPANAISGAPLSVPKKTSIKMALAPRLGFSFPLTDAASVYFSYGHFYQMPGLGELYNNSNYLVLKELQAGGINYGVMGNPDLEPQFTVQYEAGLKQAFSSAFGFELTAFYKDIRDLLGTEFVSTYSAAEYGRLTNADFGGVYGFTVALDQRGFGNFSASLDYTLQYAQGNSSDPRETANRAQTGKDPRPRDIPFNWDQRHTLNASLIYSIPGDFTISSIIRYGSGQPFTPTIGPGSFTSYLETNSGRKPDFILVDLRGEKIFKVGILEMSLFARVFNLLNTNFVNGFVFAGTGSPDYSITPASDVFQLTNPARFYEPRRIELGLTFRSL